MPEELRVAKLEVQNIGNIRHITIVPTEDVITIAGKNHHGKSNLIGSIFVAMGGKDERPEKPIKEGQIQGQILLDLGDLIVTKKFTEKGEYLEVKNKEGAVFKSPQSLLDSFYSRTTMDSDAFIDKSDKERIADLIRFTGKSEEIASLDAKSKKAYEDRTVINREITSLKGKLTGAPAEKVEEVSVSELLDVRSEAEGKVRTFEKYEQEVANLILSIAQQTDSLGRLRDELKTLQGKIAECEHQIEHDNERLTKGKALIAPETKQALISEVNSVTERINSAEQTNASARAYADAERQRKELAEKEKESQAYTDTIKKCAEDKLGILKSSGASLDGLTVEDDTLFLKGIPFSDLSSSEKLIAWMQIIISQNPKFRILRIDGGKFDSESMDKVKVWAKENRVQIWVEKVADTKQDGTIFIYEGEIKE